MNEEQQEAVLAISQDGPVLTIALNRPQRHNAMNPALIAALTAEFREASTREDVRVVVLTGSGRSFCAGADLETMRAAADYSFTENVADGEAIFDLMLAIDRCSKPVVGRINGAAIGGGVGLVSCCDIVIAVERARFAFSEVRLGLIPAVISPFVLNKIGAGHTRALFLTGERFDAAYARHIGLVHVVAADDELDAAVDEQVAMLLQGSPQAQAAAKALLRSIGRQAAEEQRDYTAHLLAQRRAADDGREGMSAFLQKRRPTWQAPQEPGADDE